MSVTERIAAHETRGLLTLHQHQGCRRTAESSFIHLRNNKRQVRYSARTDSVNKKWSDADIKKDLCRMIAYHSTHHQSPIVSRTLINNIQIMNANIFMRLVNVNIDSMDVIELN